MTNPTITLASLKRHRACGDGLAYYKGKYAEPPLLSTCLRDLVADGLFDWAEWMLKYYATSLWADYDAKLASLRADYYAKHASLGADYDAKHAPLGADYYAKHASLRADYYAKHASLGAEVIARLEVTE